jgi:hypothetical protein
MHGETVKKKKFVTAVNQVCSSSEPLKYVLRLLFAEKWKPCRVSTPTFVHILANSLFTAILSLDATQFKPVIASWRVS